MANTLDRALEALRRSDFYAQMAAAEQQMRADPEQWSRYLTERDEWLEPDASAR